MTFCCEGCERVLSASQQSHSERIDMGSWPLCHACELMTDEDFVRRLTKDQYERIRNALYGFALRNTSVHLPAGESVHTQNAT